MPPLIKFLDLPLCTVCTVHVRLTWILMRSLSCSKLGVTTAHVQHAHVQYLVLAKVCGSYSTEYMYILHQGTYQSFWVHAVHMYMFMYTVMCLTDLHNKRFVSCSHLLTCVPKTILILIFICHVHVRCVTNACTRSHYHFKATIWCVIYVFFLYLSWMHSDGHSIGHHQPLWIWLLHCPACCRSIHLWNIHCW